MSAQVDVLAVLADTRFGRVQIGTVRYENGGAGQGYRFFPTSATTWPSRKVHATPEAAIKGRVPKGTTLEVIWKRTSLTEARA